MKTLTPVQARLSSHLFRHGNEHGPALCRCGARFSDLNTLLVHAVLSTPDEAINDEPPLHAANRDDPTTDALVRSHQEARA